MARDAKMCRVVKFVLSNRFVVGVFVATLLAAVIPQGAAEGSWLFPQWTTKIGVFVIFFLQGMILPTEELRRGLAQWRVHGFTQLFIFVVMPLLAWLLSLPFTEILGPALTFGWLFLGIVPCTISTSVVYATKSGGSTIVALFNTSVANVLGIFIVPAFFVWWTGNSGEGAPIGEMLLKIVILLLLPLILGQGMRPLLRAFIDRHKHLPGKITPYIIYYIIYLSFAQAVLNRFWEKQPPAALAISFGGTVLLALVSWSLCALALRSLPFKREDKLSAFFCSTQKTVAAGVPMAQSLLAFHEWDTGVVLLPLLCYSLLQLSLGGLIVGKLEAKNVAER
ncbi:bile acid:sodium symporter [Cerasicoccus arenae]|uniref:Transporter n=1 Tax=Cerasicoccus arenae TaxID=424488 RepID=A0A8J3DER3_9BACT|nr:bile acid:sodium symporter [Cerasicoccus arenae]MBK1859389.1 bile acid:sodium symporter [Cerasicoccus arenae]GHC10700.1 transporter [Cerasicoccus arenae]